MLFYYKTNIINKKHYFYNIHVYMFKYIYKIPY